MFFSKEKVEADQFKDAYALHFCSVSLGDFPMKEAHKKAIEAATEAGAIINFDPNLRFALWEHVTVYYSRCGWKIKGAVAHYELVKVICPVSEEGTLPFFGMYGVFHELPRYRL